jgi:hypothetical protein
MDLCPSNRSTFVYQPQEVFTSFLFPLTARGDKRAGHWAMHTETGNGTPATPATLASENSSPKSSRRPWADEDEEESPGVTASVLQVSLDSPCRETLLGCRLAPCLSQEVALRGPCALPHVG